MKRISERSWQGMPFIGGGTNVGYAVIGVLMAGCHGPQSAISPAGHGAEELARLFWWMTAGAFAIWIGMVALTIYAIRARTSEKKRNWTAMLIIGGGAVFPTLVLAGLLVVGLSMLPPLLARAPEGSLKIAVLGEQWWWRVAYLSPGGDRVELANEIRIPVGELVEFELESPDVIHSFWIPSLGGKMDMIPGRRTRLTLKPTRTGVFRGACAEYCGTAHALMAFEVVVMEKAAFDRWLEGQRQSAAEPREPLESLGREQFFATGCSACHTIRGTDANGFVGPDLTHVGSRRTLGAGLLPNAPSGFERWLEATDRVKPGVHMPHFGMLPRDELTALAAYLESLQ